MSNRRIKWTAEKYKLAVQGIKGTGVPGLRSLVEGFDAADGYSLRDVDAWSTAQKRRVRDYYNRVHFLLAQEKRIVRPRSKEHLRTLQDSFHGEVPSKKFKVALVPYTDPKPLPGAKPKKSRIRYTKGGIVFDTGAYSRHFERFDKKRLAKQPDAEIKRATASMPDAKLFFLQVGEFQMLNGESANLLTQRVKRYMMQYDGKTPLPQGSGNAGDKPKYHHWKYWLNGVVGFSFPKGINTSDMQRAITQGMKKAKANRAAADKVMKSKKGQGKRKK